MKKKAFHLTCADGHLMPVYSWLPDNAPVCVLHIAHGMSEYAERYHAFASVLVRHGIGVFAHDERGHGKAVPSANDLGIADGNWFNKQVGDISIVIGHLKNTYPGKKIFLMGHSMGSFICQRFFQLHGKQVDGFILSSTTGSKDPMLGFGIFLTRLQTLFFGKRYRSKLINKLSFGKFNSYFKPNRTTCDWLNRDAALVDEYIADPLCGFTCSSLFLNSLYKGLRDIFSKENIAMVPQHIPVYAFAGDKDAVGLFGKGFMQLIDNWKLAGVKDITYRLYPGGRHEMLHEINKEEVSDDIVQWLRHTSSPSA